MYLKSFISYKSNKETQFQLFPQVCSQDVPCLKWAKKYFSKLNSHFISLWKLLVTLISYEIDLKRSSKTSEWGVGKHLPCGLHQREACSYCICHTKSCTRSNSFQISLTQTQLLITRAQWGTSAMRIRMPKELSSTTSTLCFRLLQK